MNVNIPSFEIAYDREEDLFEFTIGDSGDFAPTTVILSDDVVLYTDLSYSNLWGLTIYNFSTLYGSESVALDRVSQFSEKQRRLLISLLKSTQVMQNMTELENGQLEVQVVLPNVESLVSQLSS